MVFVLFCHYLMPLRTTVDSDWWRQAAAYNIGFWPIDSEHLLTNLWTIYQCLKIEHTSIVVRCRRRLQNYRSHPLLQQWFSLSFALGFLLFSNVQTLTVYESTIERSQLGFYFGNSITKSTDFLFKTQSFHFICISLFY